MNRQSETHPPLRERLLRLAQLDGSPPPSSENPAFLLIDGPDAVEAKVYPPKPGASAETVWSKDVLQKLMTLWEREVAAAVARRQGGLDVNSLPKLCASLPSAATFLGHAKDASDAVERILMKAFAVALNNTGWEPVLERGRLLFRRDQFSIDTAAELLRLKMRQAPDWQARCEEWKISGLHLLSEPEPRGRGHSAAVASDLSPPLSSAVRFAVNAF